MSHLNTAMNEVGKQPHVVSDPRPAGVRKCSVGYLILRVSAVDDIE